MDQFTVLLFSKSRRKYSDHLDLEGERIKKKLGKKNRECIRVIQYINGCLLNAA